LDKQSKYLPLKGAVQRYPWTRTASAIFQTYNDLLLVQQWSDLELVDLPMCERYLCASVVPCSLVESLDEFQSAFSGFEPCGELFLVISAEDSSIVYYKLPMGITKSPL
ncbi:hypothetical protein EDB87DRAFT_1571636, partial [Lactarius vividus]